MERTRRGPFLFQEDLVTRVGKLNRRGTAENPAHTQRKTSPSLDLEGRSVFGDKKKRSTPRTTRLSLLVASAFGNSGLTKDSK
jgi:hypothetical protein